MSNPFAVPGMGPPPSDTGGFVPDLPPPPQKAPDNGPLDQVGRALFGQGTGSLLGGLPGVGDLGRFVGEAAHNIAEPIRPIDWISYGVSHVPLGGAPGGADEKFTQMGDWMKTHRPDDYTAWQVVQKSSYADAFAGANTRADFTREYGTKYLDETKGGPDGFFANNPGLGLSPPGSLGQAIGDALGFAGLAGLEVQKRLGENASTGRGIYQLTPEQNAQLAKLDIGSPEYAALEQQFSQQPNENRLGQVKERIASGAPLNDLEQVVADHLADGSWTDEHALNYIVRQGQGISRDFLPQLLGGIATDPTTYAALGTGAALKAGAIGARVVEGGVGAQSALEHAGVALHAVQNSSLAPIFKVGRSIIDPFSLMGTNTATKGLVDMVQGAATKGIERAYGADAFSKAFKAASEYGFTADLQGALGTYSANLARKWVIVEHRITQLKGLGEKITPEQVVPDDVVDTLMRSASKDAVDRFSDYAYGTRKQFVGNAADDAQLAGRMTASFGRSADDWTKDIAGMSDDEKSLWHAATYSNTWQDFAKAMAEVGGYKGKLPLDRLVILNDSNLDNIAAQAVRDNLSSIEGVTAQAREWNAMAAKYSDIADLGKATASRVGLDKLFDRLDGLIASGRLHTRALPDELTDSSLAPLRDFLDRHTVNGEQLWHVGFRPDDIHAWGLTRDRVTGLLRVERDPFVSHVTDATPAARPINDIARNLMGQIIGPKAAGIIARPIEAVEVAMKTAADAVSGERLMLNMEQRFTKGMTKFGVQPREAKKLFQAAREAAQLQHTTIQGVNPENVWQATKGLIPPELRGVVTQRGLMTELLDASGGDLRIMGLTSAFTQRMRTALARSGLDPINYSGQATVTFYRMARYSLNPTFFIQRITDGAYFNALRGVMPVGAKEFAEGTPLWHAQRVLERMGETAMARDFAMDMPEYQLRSAFQTSVRDKLSKLPVGRVEGLASAGSRWQLNNMVKQFHSNVGTFVKEGLDEAKATYEKLANDATLTQAERDGYRAAVDGFDEFAAMREQYSLAAGRTLTDQEVGLKYLQETFNDALSETRSPEGLVEFKHNIKTGEYHKPAGIGELRPLGLNHLAADLGFTAADGSGDIKALRSAIGPEGEHSVAWLKERLTEDFSAHPDYVKRAVDALSFDWQEFMGGLRTSLDLTPQASQRLEGVLAREAALRDMTPVEYVSQVLKTNLGQVSLDDHLGRVLALTKAGAGTQKAQIEKLTDVFMGTVDLSAQQTLREFLSGKLEETIQATGNADLARAASNLKDNIARFTTDARGNAKLPANFVPEQGYVYRVVSDGASGAAWEPGTYVSAGKPSSIYVTDPSKARIVRAADPGDLTPAIGGVDAAANSRVVNAIGPEAQEVLGADGVWRPVAGATGSTSEQFADLLSRRMAGEAIANPDVEHIAQFFIKWTRELAADELGKSRGWVGKLADELTSKVPTGPAFAYNRSQALVEELLRQKIVLAQRDAFRLAEMQTRRTVLNRSLNHPVFGLYPSSYMWGKVFPEMARFIAKDPFGFETSYGPLLMAKVEQSVATQREYDPNFADAEKHVSGSATAFLLDYLTPSLPWSDMSASAPPWLKALQKKGIDASAILGAEIKTFSPDRWVNQFLHAGKEIGDVIGSSVKPEEPPVPNFGDLNQLLTQPSEAAPSPSVTSNIGPTQATGLGPILTNEMDDLAGILSNP